MPLYGLSNGWLRQLFQQGKFKDARKIGPHGTWMAPGGSVREHFLGHSPPAGFLLIGEVARRLDCSVERVRYLIERGYFDGIRKAKAPMKRGRWYIPEWELGKFEAGGIVKKVKICELTPRERECLELAASGSSNQAIGYQLNVSPRTVANHLESVRIKLGASNTTHAVYLAVRSGMLA